MSAKLRLASVLILLALPTGLRAQNPPVTVSVDAAANRHAISPLIYGVNLFEDPHTTSTLQDLNCPLNRYGGNRASTYNWQLNSDNRGNDFFFERISDDSQMPAERGDTFTSQTKAASAEPMVTIPILDWISQAGTMQPLPCSYPRARFPSQRNFGDPFDPDCGDGVALDGSLLDGADPNDAFVANTLPTQQAWVQHIVTNFGAAANGGVKYYILDNEHDISWETHHDVVPTGLHHTEDRDRMFAYAGMVKAIDPGALIVGPEPSGWLGYELSPFDRQYGELNGFPPIDTFPDRMAMNGMDYIPWLLGQFHQYEINNNQRLLDVLTVHYYPQGGNNNSNTRSLWDPNFVDPSYIDDKIMLIPRMKKWVADNYPGTKIGITEYNWGGINDEAASDNIGYAVTQADVLGIFGREGLDLATRFNAPPANLPTYNAMKMYRNYDGQKSTFGDVSVLAAVPDPDTLAAFAAQRSSDGTLTVMLINKVAAGSTPVTVNLATFAAGNAAQVWQLTSTNTITRTADAAVNNSVLNLLAPPQSVTLLVVPQAAPAGDFALSAANPPAVNIVAGNPSQPIALEITASGAFQDVVTLACLTATGATCSFAPAAAPTVTLSPRAGTPAKVLLTLGTDATTIGGIVTVTASSNAGSGPKSTDILLNIDGGAGNADVSVSVAPTASTPNPVAIGRAVGFDVTVSNAGPSDVDASLTITFDPPLLSVSAPGCNPILPVKCDLAILNGLSTTVTITGVAPRAHDLVINASVFSGAADTMPDNNRAMESLKVRFLSRTRH